LSFADDSDSFNSVFPVEFTERLGGDVEDASLANMHCFVGFKVEAVYKLRNYAGRFLQVLFFAENLLVEVNVYHVVLEFAGFFPVSADYDPEKQVAAACVVNDNCQTAGFPFLYCQINV
jgi:hypothetical protein